MNRTTRRNSNLPRKRFLGQFEKLESRNLLTVYPADLADDGQVQEGESIVVTLTLTTPFDQTWGMSFSQWGGNASYLYDYTYSFDPAPSISGSYWPASVSTINVTVTAIDEGFDYEPMMERLVLKASGGEVFSPADSFVSNEVTILIADEQPSSEQVAAISDPPCNCNSSDSASSSQLSADTGNVAITPPVQQRALSQYGPRYSTAGLRPVTYSMDTRFAQDSVSPTTIDVDGVIYDTTGISTGDTFRVSGQMDTTGLPAGRYAWSMEFTEDYASATDISYELSGHSLFGGPSNVLLSPGWSIPAIDQLTVTSDGALWKSSGDRLLWFTELAGDYLRPDGDQEFSALVDNLDGTFTISNRWGDILNFNSLGLVTEKIDKNGRTTTFTYIDADSDYVSDDISEVETFDGRTLVYDYTGGLISSITDFDGRTIELAYDVSDRLETITYPDPDGAGSLDSFVSEYAYDASTDFIESVDDNGDVTEFAYNFAGALISRTNPDSTVEEFDAYQMQAVVDPGSGMGTISYPAPLFLTQGLTATQEDDDGETTTYFMNALGLAIKTVDALGNQTTYVRDANGRVTLQTDPDPDGVGSEPAPETEYVYDASGNLIEMTLPNGGERSWVYDATWNIPEEYVDERGLLTIYDVNATTGLVDSERKVVGDIDDLINLEEDDVVTEYTYTSAPSGPSDPPAGLVETLADPLGRITVYTYNARGDVTSVTYADGTTDEAIVQTFYNSDGTVDYQLDELSRRTDYDYDLLGRVILKTLPDPDAGGPLARPEIEFEYDTWNRLTKQIDPLERETIYTYDERGRRTKVELPDHDGDTQLTTSTTKYNDLGQTESITDPLGRETTFEYDKIGRQTKTILPEVADHSTSVNEIQIIDFDSGTEGTFKLNGNSKYGVIDLADLSDLQSVLDDIWGAGNTSAVYTSTEATITFKGDYSATNVAQMTVSDITGTLGATPSVSTDTGGVAADLVNPTTETEYDPLGRVISTTDAIGTSTTYEYTNFGQNLKITLPDPDGGGGLTAPIMYQEFDEAGNLISETDANGGETIRDYDILGRLTKVTQPDPDGGGPLAAPVTEYQYDLAGNRRFILDPLGNVTEFQYDYRNRQVKVISADPDGVGALSELVTENTYDDASQLTKITAPGNRVTEYDYDGLGRLILTTLPDPDGAGALARPELESSYDAASQKLTDTDALDNVTTYDYDALGNLIELTQPDPDAGGSLAAPISVWEYDAAGQLLAATDALGNITTYDYDNLGRTTKITQPDPDAGGSQTAPVIKRFYDLSGNLLLVMNPLKLETSNEYDFLNRRIISRDALGGETTFTYDAHGNMLSLTDPVDNTTSWVYDALNRVTQETNELYDNRYFYYDAVGNLIRRTDRLSRDIIYEYDNLYRQTAEEWWNGVLPSISVSTNNDGYKSDEVQRVGFSDYYSFVSGTFTLTYDGQTTSAIAWDADAATVQTALVALSNLASGEVLVTKVGDYSYWQEWQVTFAAGLAATDVPQITIDPSSVYNGSGPPAFETETTDVAGATVDEVQVVTLNSTTGGTFKLSFGAQTTAPIAWDASTSTVDAAIEALSGAGTISVSGSAGGPYTVTFTGAYGGQNIAPLQQDANDLSNANLLRTIAYVFNDDGDLEEISDPDATYEFTYDGLGRVTNYVQNIAGLNPEIEFVSEYNASGRRELLQAILGGDEDFQNTYAYDDMLRLSTMVQQSGTDNVVAPKQIEFNYNELSQYTRIDRYAATTATEFVASSHYKYDDLNRLLKLVHSETTTAPTSGWGTDPLAGYEYGYDAASRILSIDSLQDGLSTYVHDNTNQLIDADHATMTDEAYEYDANGNRIMSGYDVDPNNQLYSDGTYSYTYDDEGNRVTRTKISNGYVTRYEWDFRNRLTKVTEEDNASTVLQVTENFYDTNNQWIRRRFDADGPGGAAAVDTFFAHESGQVVFEFDGDNAADLSHRYLWGEMVDHAFTDETVTSLGSAGAALWTFGDHLGTIRDLVTYNSSTDDATVANHREWDSYGNLGIQSNATYASTIGYTGRPFDETTGLQNNLYRWYDPSNGFWITIDPSGFAAGDPNLQSYVGNSPLLSSDPAGLVAIQVGGRPAEVSFSVIHVNEGRLYNQALGLWHPGTAGSNTSVGVNGSFVPGLPAMDENAFFQDNGNNFGYMWGVEVRAKYVGECPAYWVQYVTHEVTMAGVPFSSDSHIDLDGENGVLQYDSSYPGAYLTQRFSQEGGRYIAELSDTPGMFLDWERGEFSVEPTPAGGQAFVLRPLPGRPVASAQDYLVRRPGYAAAAAAGRTETMVFQTHLVSQGPSGLQAVGYFQWSVDFAYTATGINVTPFPGLWRNGSGGLPL